MAAPIKNYKIRVPSLAHPIEVSTHVQTTIIVDAREVVPLIFVPGIMGTHLVNADGELVWAPTKAGITSYLVGGAKRKRTLLIGESGHQHTPDYLQVYKPREGNGRESVFASSYKPFFEFLDRHRWSASVEERYRLPLYVFGYNWTNSNEHSGRLLAERIEEIMAECRKNGHVCRHVILITHSMGGLVARAACLLHGAAASVLGVIHAVQPATGAAAAYWRMRAGFPRKPGSIVNPIANIRRMISTVTAWVLGTNGREVTALLGNMPGGLELLPNRHYTTNAGARAWLRYERTTTALWSEREEPLRSFPERGDPYGEIYRERAGYWRLVRDEWLDPENADVDETWVEYLKRVGAVEAFQDSLGLEQHGSTFHLYGTGHETVDEVVYDVEPLGIEVLDVGHMEHVLQTEHEALNEALVLGRRLRDAVFDPRQNHGGDTHYYTAEYEGESDYAGAFRAVLQPGEGEGDETVPVSSGRALAYLSAGEREDGAERLRGGTRDVHAMRSGHESIYTSAEAQAKVATYIERLLIPD